MRTIVFAERHFDSAAGPLTVRRGGKGRALLHLHSAAGPRISPVVQALADHHDVHAPIAPGLEKTPRLEGVNTPRDLADLYAQYIRAECGGVCDVVGESFGGWIALWLAVRHPDLVGQLVLEGPAGLRAGGKGGLPADAQTLTRMLYAHPERAPRETHTEEARMANRKAVERYVGGVAYDEELAARLGDIRARTLVLMGAQDQIIPPETGHLLKTRVPQSHLTYIWGAAHAIEFDEPRRVATLALDFLDRGESFLVRPAAGGAPGSQLPEPHHA